VNTRPQGLLSNPVIYEHPIRDAVPKFSSRHIQLKERIQYLPQTWVIKPTMQSQQGMLWARDATVAPVYIVVTAARPSQSYTELADGNQSLTQTATRAHRFTTIFFKLSNWAETKFIRQASKKHSSDGHRPSI